MVPRKAWVIASFVLGVGTLIYPTYRHFYINGLRAEARIMLTYLHTLEKVYRSESGHYAYFPEYYGANVDGHSFCQQPEGAKTLGFYLRWCHEKEAGREPVLYAYQVLPGVGDQDGYRAAAVSGSDSSGASFVCFGEREVDVWYMDQNRSITHEKSCDRP